MCYLRRMPRARFAGAVLLLAALLPSTARAQTVGQVFQRANSSVVTVRTTEREIAAINQGNSGGPMFNMQAEVIGVVSHIISKSGGFEGLGFVVSSNMARKLLLEQRSFWSGTAGFVVSGELAKVFNLPQPVGLLVQRIA